MKRKTLDNVKEVKKVFYYDLLEEIEKFVKIKKEEVKKEKELFSSESIKKVSSIDLKDFKKFIEERLEKVDEEEEMLGLITDEDNIIVGYNEPTFTHCYACGKPLKYTYVGMSLSFVSSLNKIVETSKNYGVPYNGTFMFKTSELEGLTKTEYCNLGNLVNFGLLEKAKDKDGEEIGKGNYIADIWKINRFLDGMISVPKFFIKKVGSYNYGLSSEQVYIDDIIDTGTNIDSKGMPDNVDQLNFVEVKRTCDISRKKYL